MTTQSLRRVKNTRCQKNVCAYKLTKKSRHENISQCWPIGRPRRSDWICNGLTLVSGSGLGTCLHYKCLASSLISFRNTKKVVTFSSISHWLPLLRIPFLRFFSTSTLYTSSILCYTSTLSVQHYFITKTDSELCTSRDRCFLCITEYIEAKETRPKGLLDPKIHCWSQSYEFRDT